MRPPLLGALSGVPPESGRLRCGRTEGWLRTIRRSGHSDRASTGRVTDTGRCWRKVDYAPGSTVSLDYFDEAAGSWVGCGSWLR